MSNPNTLNDYANHTLHDTRVARGQEQQTMPETTTLLNIEFNSSCNLRCRWCSLDHGRPRRSMSPETLDALLRQLAQNALPALRHIDLHNGGETLLHPDMSSMLNVLRRWKPFLPGSPRIRLLTNGMALSERKAVQIVQSGVIDRVRFSIDGGSPGQYESIRRGARWEALTRNVLRFMAHNNHAAHRAETEAICLLPAGHAEPFAPEFASLLSHFDTVSLRHPHNWDGSAELGVDDSGYRETASRMQGKCCFLLLHNLVVLPEGDVTACCNDLNARLVLGNIHTTGIGAIARSEIRTAMRRLMEQGRKHEIPLCRQCTGFFQPG